MKASVLQSIFDQAKRHPSKPALIGPGLSLNYAQLCDQFSVLAEHLRAINPSAIAIQADNSIAWVLADLAAAQAKIPLVPVPTFFTTEQAWHVMRDAGVELLLVDDADRFVSLLGSATDHFCFRMSGDLGLLGCAVSMDHRPDLDGVAKVTYTSGSTGTPKGVCLSAPNLDQVAEALQARTHYDAKNRHCCVLPLSTLLENLAGVYVPLMSGASVYLWPESSRGLLGARLVDASKMHQLLLQTSATSVILTPGLLQALVAVIKASRTGLPALRVVAVGGALVSVQLIKEAHSLGLPVIQGYGLSECASVVSLTAPGETALSTGRALPHVSVEIAEDGEVLVHGNVFLGYLGEPRNDEEKAWPTGDLGYLDQDGRLHITGRKKNLIITDQGRNVSPEWVERSLLDQFGIDQVAVFGEARPFLIAVVTANATISDTQIQQSVDRANAGLPDYARIGEWLRSEAAFSQANGQMSAKAEPQREQIARVYADAIDSIYSLKEPCYGVL